MSETAEQIRAAVLEPWCPKCGLDPARADAPRADCMVICACGERLCLPLFDRCPESRVPGLEWSEETEQWVLRKHIGGPQVCRLRECEPHHAALLNIGQLSGLLAKAASFHTDAIKLYQALASDMPVTALAALCHRLKDQQEQSDG